MSRGEGRGCLYSVLKPELTQGLAHHDEQKSKPYPSGEGRISPILQRQKLRPGERERLTWPRPSLGSRKHWASPFPISLSCCTFPPPHLTPVPTWVRVWCTGAAQVHTATRHLLQPRHIHGCEPRQRLQVPGKVIITGGGQEPAGRSAYQALAVRPVGHFLQTQRQQHRFISSSGLSPCEVIIPPFLLLQPRKLRGMEARELAQDACFSPTCLLCKLGS